ncbi:MAG: PAS domain S-box protein [Syntrophaceae bacterium]|nr:PAS domain S-box protein [Syntrophaceae bacterium]HQM46548.1 PAS domain S-box protein [Smithellaceae bacterium]
MTGGKIEKKELNKPKKHLRTESDGIKMPASLRAFGEDIYNLLAHSSQIGFYIMQDGHFKLINSHIRDYTGCTEEEMLKMDPASFILPEDRRKAAENSVMMLKKQRFSPYEFRIVTKDGRIKWIMESVMPIKFMGKGAILGNSMDITERKEASRRLEELEALESSILDAIPQAVVGLHERRINFANHAVKVIFGWHREELIGKSIGMIYRNEEESDKIASAFYSTLEHQRTYETEFPCLRKDGQEICCRMKASRIGENLREKRIVVTYEDITAEKKAQEDLKRSREELRNLSIHLQSVREEESTRVARKIHDELGQSLTALQMDLSWLVNHLPAGSKDICHKTQSMSELVESTIESVHNITTELRPSLLDDLGLPTAIEWQASDFQKRSGIRCRVHIHCPDQVIDQELATTIFRIFQETLTNIARHAQATQCKVNLTQTETELHLEVTDNGIGINQWQIDDPRSFGMIGMRERAHLWGGTVHIRNVQPTGTKVRVLIPVNKGERRHDTHISCR